MSQALYRKWRPRLWDKVVGQEHIVQTFKNAIRTERVGHAYLLAGPRGTGKTTTARLLAKAVNCLAEDPAVRPCDQCAHCKAVNEGHFLDLIEIDAASNTSVDDMRDLRDKINFSPSQGRYKVYIIDEVHMLSTAAFNALLKTLEEPPAHAIFILATTEVHKIPATVLSRCQRHEFRRIPVPDIVAQLQDIVDGEGFTAEKEALTLIARQSTGAMRDAISLLDQLASTGEGITLANAQQVLGTATSQVVVDLVGAIQSKDSQAGLNAIHQALDAGTDPRQFARQVVDYLRGLLLIRLNNADLLDVTQEMRAHMAAQAAHFDSAELVEAVRQFNTAATEARTGWQPALPLELALAECLHTAPQPAAASRPVVPAQPEPARPTPSQPTPARPSPSQPDPARPAPSQPTPAQPTPSRPTPSRSAPADEAAPAGVSLHVIVQQWKAFCQAMRVKSPAVQGLLNSCRPLAIKDGRLVLGFASEVLRTKMDTPENIGVTQQLLLEMFSADLPVSCVVANTKGGSAELDVDGDGMVNTALNLGGQIVHKE
ncbi:DNA polymerase III subunit gamma/tau [Levilinea saccharolytica]|uniref:DNA polymerase III subunit gamma/tau n=3 Tax=Levilinea saccharolytica TaxID=229921 RepID=UPI0009463E4C|nr:DNA polymerase III subunit gamma/tau [Levilinea saccharolytica]